MFRGETLPPPYFFDPEPPPPNGRIRAVYLLNRSRSSVKSFKYIRISPNEMF